LPGDAAITSHWALWLYIAKGLAILFLSGIVLTNLVYGVFELLDLLGG
jgi:hypothetical protein